MKNKKSMLILFLMVFWIILLAGSPFVSAEEYIESYIPNLDGSFYVIKESSGLLSSSVEVSIPKVEFCESKFYRGIEKSFDRVSMNATRLKFWYDQWYWLIYKWVDFDDYMNISLWLENSTLVGRKFIGQSGLPYHDLEMGYFDYEEQFELDAPNEINSLSINIRYNLVNGVVDRGPEIGDCWNSDYFLFEISIYNFVADSWNIFYMYENTGCTVINQDAVINNPVNGEFIQNGKIRLKIFIRNQDTSVSSSCLGSGDKCFSFELKKFLYQYCYSSENCYDGVQNGDETGVDCGGSCAPCVSCDNRIKDGDEEGVDCGGSCLNDCAQLKILAVPLRWTGTQSEFNDAVDTQINFFINATPLKNCPETIKVEKLNVRNYNFDNFSCSKTNCGVYKIKPFIESKGINVKNYHYIIGFVENSPCFLAGCSNGEDTAWVETEYDVVAAHEIGHFYGLEDEYCSNQAGSKDSRCNDGNESWTLIGITILPNDINYLDADLGCDPHGQPCCNYDPWHNCSTLPRAGYGVCCKGNIVNSEGGRAIMSYANADGPREFDEHSKNHLAKYPKLNCPSGLADYNIETVITGKIIDLNLNVFQNNSVEEQNIHLVDGEGNIHDSKEGNYNLLIYDNENFVLFNHSVYHLFDYDGPVIDGNDYSQINLTSFQLSMKIPYDNNMYILYLKHNDITIFSKILDFCNQDGICNGTETYLSCWDDCKSYSQDGLCLNYTGDGCDPDCAEDIDPDCKSTLVGKTFLGVNSITHANEIKMELLNKLTLNFTVIETMNNNNGDFVIDGIEPGNYSIWVKPEYYLAVRNNSVELVEGKNNIEFRASHVDFNNGPSNQSYNKVDFWDLGPFLKAWDSNCSSENYKWYIDINSNCKIDFYDLPPFSGSYGLVGEPSLKP